MRVYTIVILSAVLLAACGGGGGAVEEASPAAGDPAAGAAATSGQSALAPDEMPAPLADFPLPDDVTFPSPPLEESGRLVVTLNSETDVEEVKALIDEGLEPAGYEVTHFVEQGAAQWQFVKDGREGTVTVGSNPVGTIITINLFA